MSMEQVGEYHLPTPYTPNTYEDPVVKRQTLPRSGFFPFFPLGFRLSIVRLWQRVLSSFSFAGAPMGLHQTLIEVLSSR